MNIVYDDIVPSTVSEETDVALFFSLKVVRSVQIAEVDTRWEELWKTTEYEEIGVSVTLHNHPKRRPLVLSTHPNIHT